MAYQRMVRQHSPPSSDNGDVGECLWITINRSCDMCAMKKRKCGGNGVDPCSRCKRMGNAHRCVYRKRRPQPPRAHRSRKQAEEVLPEVEVQSLKRCRISASTATGLVGLEENALLSSFFECMSFMPLTTQSTIREAMVKIMSASTTPKTLASEAVMRSTVRLPMDTSTCAFWCAVALGGLVQGRPIDTVAHYVRLAESALEQCSGIMTAEVAQAWTIVGYLHGYCGDVDRFLKYLRRTDASLRDSTVEGSYDDVPVGFAEMVSHADEVTFLEGRDASGTGLKAFCSNYVSPSPVSQITAEDEVFRWVMLSYRRFGQAFLADIYANKGEEIDNTERVDVEASGDNNPSEDAGHEPSLAALSGLASNPTIIGNMVERIRDTFDDFEWLEGIVDRSTFASGLGGIIINGTLVFAKAAKGDVTGVLDRMTRCADALARYPGLCRFSMCFHIAHVMIATLAAVSSVELYEKVRKAYNAMRPVGDPLIPPLAEYDGLNECCDHVYCRSWERAIQSGELTFCDSPWHRNREETDRCFHADPATSFSVENHSEQIRWAHGSSERASAKSSQSSGIVVTTSRGENGELGTFNGSVAGAADIRSATIWPGGESPAGWSGADFDAHVPGVSCEERNECDSVLSLPDSVAEGLLETEGDISSADWLDVTYALLPPNLGKDRE